MPAEQAAKRPREPLLQTLLAAGEPMTAQAAVESMRLRALAADRGARPYVLLNMVASIDGAASLQGRSGGLSDPADRALFHALRAVVDGVLVGARTARVERYGRMIRDQDTRRRRLEQGLSEEPTACIVAGNPARLEGIPLFAEPAASVALLTCSSAILPAVAARVQYVRSELVGAVDLAASLGILRERMGIGLLLCEGGPSLALQLFSLGLIDELMLSLAPLLAGGDSLRMLDGAQLAPPVALELRRALCVDSRLFLRYAVCSGARVARETTLKSSLAS